MWQFDTPTSRCKQRRFLLHLHWIKVPIFIWVTHPHFELNEELLSVDPLKETTTDQDLFNAVENCVNITGLLWNKMTSAITDGARAITGKSIMNNKIKEYLPDHTLLPLLCVNHQDRLCTALLNFKQLSVW